jgi:hypothetical protein
MDVLSERVCFCLTLSVVESQLKHDLSKRFVLIVSQ